MLCHRNKTSNPSPLLLNVTRYSLLAKAGLAHPLRFASTRNLRRVRADGRRLYIANGQFATNAPRKFKYFASNPAEVSRSRHASTLCSSRNVGSPFDGLLNCGSVRPAMNIRFDGKYLHVRQVLNSVTLPVRRSRYDEAATSHVRFIREYHLLAAVVYRPPQTRTARYAV